MIDALEQEQIQVRGDVLVQVVDDATGVEVERREIRNLVVTAGKNLIAAMLVGSGTRPTHMAAGTSSTAAAAGDVALGGEVSRQVVTVAVSAAVATFYGYFPSTAGNGSTWREVGLFNASSGGTMLARAVFASIVKTNSVTVTVTWQITIS